MRLTKAIKERLVDDLLKKKIEPERQGGNTGLRVWAELCYKELYPEHVLKRMEELPEGWLSSKSGFNVSVGALRAHATMEKSRRFLATHCNTYSVILALSKDSPLGERYLRLCRKKQELDKQREQLTSEIYGVLNSVTTVKRLLEVWPEIHPYVKHLDQPSANLPAVLPEKLNEELGLK